MNENDKALAVIKILFANVFICIVFMVLFLWNSIFLCVIHIYNYLVLSFALLTSSQKVTPLGLFKLFGTRQPPTEPIQLYFFYVL